VIILDIMLPGMDGVGVLKRLRQSGDRVPVVMLTARDAIPDKVYSLNLGADDYLTKPFSTEEFLARMGTLLRRTEEDEVLQIADLSIERPIAKARSAGDPPSPSNYLRTPPAISAVVVDSGNRYQTTSEVYYIDKLGSRVLLRGGCSAWWFLGLSGRGTAGSRVEAPRLRPC
jgi:DNA-binding LytR/AlgR family response regulator